MGHWLEYKFILIVYEVMSVCNFKCLTSCSLHEDEGEEGNLTREGKFGFFYLFIYFF